MFTHPPPTQHKHLDLLLHKIKINDHYHQWFYDPVCIYILKKRIFPSFKDFQIFCNKFRFSLLGPIEVCVLPFGVAGIVATGSKVSENVQIIGEQGENAIYSTSLHKLVLSDNWLGPELKQLTKHLDRWGSSLAMEMAGKHSDHYFCRCQPNKVTTIFYFLEKKTKSAQNCLILREKLFEIPPPAPQIFRVFSKKMESAQNSLIW